MEVLLLRAVEAEVALVLVLEVAGAMAVRLPVDITQVVVAQAGMQALAVLGVTRGRMELPVLVAVAEVEQAELLYQVHRNLQAVVV